MDYSEKNLKHYAYLLMLLSSAINGTPPEEPNEEIDFEYIYKIAENHHILNTVFYSIEKLKTKPDGELYKKWENYRNKAFHRSITQRAELSAIKKAFEKNSIEYLPVKGFPICDIYPQPDYRYMGDLDILVKDTNAADKVILSLGYTAKQIGVSHHDVFLKPPFMLVEIHRDLVKADSELFNYYKNVFDRAEKINSFHYELSREDFYIYSIVHFEKHYVSAGTGIRSISDLYLMNKKFLPELNNAYIENELIKLGLSDFRNKMSKIADKWFLKNDYKTFSEKELFIFSSGAYGTTENKVSAIKGDKGKLFFIFRRLFPKPNTMKWIFPWVKEYPILLPWAYFYRLFHDGIGRRKEAIGEMKALNSISKK